MQVEVELAVSKASHEYKQMVDQIIESGDEGLSILEEIIQDMISPKDENVEVGSDDEKYEL